jgi:predicted secreted protein
MQTPSPQQLPTVNVYMKWGQEHDDTLVDILMTLQADGVLPPYGKQLPNITHMLNERICDGTIYTVKQVDGKIGYLRGLYVNFLEFVRDKAGTGCGWDDELGTVTGTPEQWEHIRVVSHITYAYHFIIKYFYVFTSSCFPFWAYHLFDLPFQTKSLTKYYKYRNGPPRNFNSLCLIFAGSTATGKWRYASTQSPPASDDEHNIEDIDVPPPAIVDLIEPRSAHGSSKGKGKGKLKRSSCPLEGSKCSKRSNTGEKIMADTLSQFQSMRSDYLDKCKISDGMSSKAPTKQFPEEEVMDNINRLRKELQLPAKTYLRACRKIKSRSWARIVLKMDEEGLRDWLLDLIKPTDK